MGLLGTIRDTLQASTQSANRGDITETDSEGAFWCHDCDERLRDVAVEGEGPPTCPSCGDEMTFERSVGTTGCAC
jgi:Zn finger protein HypA/HybF involved in hydrogenase expression